MKIEKLFEKVYHRLLREALGDEATKASPAVAAADTKNLVRTKEDSRYDFLKSIVSRRGEIPNMVLAFLDAAYENPEVFDSGFNPSAAVVKCANDILEGKYPGVEGIRKKFGEGGSGRVAYDFTMNGETWALKIAKNDTGKQQNGNEYSVAYKSHNDPTKNTTGVKLGTYGKDFSWILAEKLKPLGTNQYYNSFQERLDAGQFFDLMGISWRHYQRGIEEINHWLRGHLGLYIQGAPRSSLADRYPTLEEFFENEIPRASGAQKGSKAYKFMYNVAKMVLDHKGQMVPGDLLKLDSYGVRKDEDGNSVGIALLDYGQSKELMRKFGSIYTEAARRKGGYRIRMRKDERRD
jgi:hypothetical protein